jgi:hypothetical protein
MNENEFDLAARAWLDDGPIRMSDRALLSALEEIHRTRQRRAMWPAWKATAERIFARVAIAAVLVVAVGLLAINVFPRQPDGSSIGGPPTPTPAQAVDFPNLTATFVSPRNGFSIKHPDRVALTPAKQLWGFSKQVDDGFDVLETGLAAVFKGASTETPSGNIDDYVSDEHVLPGGCGVPRSQQAEITIDGEPGRIAECPNHIEATVVAGGRLYLFTLSHDRGDARAVFDAFVATIDLRPKTAVAFPGLTTTFFSPTYGFSFGYLDRGEGTLTPAKERWDPARGTPYDDAFDTVETGLGAVFQGASTEIPKGVSIDDWTDATLAGLASTRAHICSGPRSEQVPITIDGKPGKISEVGGQGTLCSGQIVATAVVDRRLYVFTLGHTRNDARAFFDAFAATIDLRPEDAAVPSSTPSS